MYTHRHKIDKLSICRENDIYIVSYPSQLIIQPFIKLIVQTKTTSQLLSSPLINAAFTGNSIYTGPPYTHTVSKLLVHGLCLQALPVTALCVVQSMYTSFSGAPYASYLC